MSSNSQQPIPDLASVLQTLSQLEPQNHQNHQNQSPHQGGYTQAPIPTQQAWQAPIKSFAPPQPSGPQNALPPQKIVDPATIVDWSSGLRCVMKTVSKHEGIFQDIRKMIKVQHEHEEEWFEGRKALVGRQKMREEGQKKLDEMLKAVGGAPATGTSDTSPEVLARELETFDMKIYKAQLQMVKEMSTRLRNHGIPFFGTKSELVRVSGSENSNGKEGMIDEAELVKLQRKMIALLEDLCKD